MRNTIIRSHHRHYLTISLDCCGQEVPFIDMDIEILISGLVNEIERILSLDESDEEKVNHFGTYINQLTSPELGVDLEIAFRTSLNNMRISLEDDEVDWNFEFLNV